MRKKRVIESGSAYHVISRIAHQSFLLDESERDEFVSLLRRVADFSGIEVYTYAVMSNHFHLLVRIPRPTEVSDDELLRRLRVLYGETRFAKTMKRWKWWEDHGMGVLVEETKKRLVARMYDLVQFVKTLKESYTVGYNRRHNHYGTIWESRFKSLLAESSHEGLMLLGSYIDTNPVKAHMAKKAGDYRWSGFGAASRGDAWAKRGLQSMMQAALPEGARLLTEEEAISRYRTELVRIRPPCLSGLDTDSESIQARIETALANGEPLDTSYLGYCHVAQFERGGIVGSASFVQERLNRSGSRRSPAAMTCWKSLNLFVHHNVQGVTVKFAG